MPAIQNEAHVDWVDGRPVIDMQNIKSIEYHVRIDETWVYWKDGEIEKHPGQLLANSKPVGSVVAL